nr:hypothetical protein [Edaphobacter aggregans]
MVGHCSSGKHNRLEEDAKDFLTILGGELNNASDRVIVHGVDDRDLQRDTHSRRAYIVDSLQLYIQVVAYTSMSVLFFGHAINLKKYAV